MYNLEIVSKKGGIFWTYTMGKYEERPDGMGQYIWRWSVEMGNTIFQGTVKNHRYSVSYSRSVVWKVHDIIQAADDIYQ